MARPTCLFTIGHVAKRIGENLELLEQIAMNSDNIDYGEMIAVYDGSDESQTAFTERGVESLQEFLAEVRTWPGGIRAFLEDEGCDAATIARIMADQPKP